MFFLLVGLGFALVWMRDSSVYSIVGSVGKVVGRNTEEAESWLGVGVPRRKMNMEREVAER